MGDFGVVGWGAAGMCKGVLFREGTSVSIKCLLTVDHYEPVSWYNSKGQQLDDRDRGNYPKA